MISVMDSEVGNVLVFTDGVNMEKLTRNSVLHKVVSELPVTEGGHHRPLAREGCEELRGTKARQD